MEVTSMPAADRPRERYRYRVTGSGTFPLDMLGYDAAYPANSEAVSGMSHREREQRTVELISYHRPTEDRWRSFGWLVE